MMVAVQPIKNFHEALLIESDDLVTTSSKEVEFPILERYTHEHFIREFPMMEMVVMPWSSK